MIYWCTLFSLMKWPDCVLTTSTTNMVCAFMAFMGTTASGRSSTSQFMATESGELGGVQESGRIGGPGNHSRARFLVCPSTAASRKNDNRKCTCPHFRTFWLKQMLTLFAAGCEKVVLWGLKIKLTSSSFVLLKQIRLKWLHPGMTGPQRCIKKFEFTRQQLK